jgi:hypothetical protein
MEKPNARGPLSALRAKIATVLATKPQCFITHPSELHVLRSLRADELRDFAEKNGWRQVCRVGGHQIEFYNHASVREKLGIETYS